MGKKRGFEKGKAKVHPRELGREYYWEREKESSSEARRGNLWDYYEVKAWGNREENKKEIGSEERRGN